MQRNRILLIVLLVTGASVLLVALFLNPFRGLKLLASVADATRSAQLTTSPEEAPDVVFSDETVANLSSSEERFATATDTPITVETNARSEEHTPDLKVESIYSNNEVSHKIFYTYDINTLTTDIHAFTNQLRVKEGLSPLVFDPHLAALAIERSTDMADNGTFSHTASDGCDLECRFSQSNYATLSWGENIAEYEPYTRLTPSELAERLIKRWVASSGHKRNLLSSDFSHEGIGVAMNGNRIVVTVIFSRPE